MTTTSGGNISRNDTNGDIWVNPSAIDICSIRPSDIICVKKDGTIISKHKPSSEFPFHKAIQSFHAGWKKSGIGGADG